LRPKRRRRFCPRLPRKTIEPMNPIMSVKEARKLLGKKYEHMTDEEVTELVEQTHEFAKLALEMAKQERLKKSGIRTDD
ncbi:hypothetical protein KC963_03180, partial [Candidatus Saccharibacteria bacterium]|nr:hypothetical protein [Candidatus Saccharibacteria bacterium]